MSVSAVFIEAVLTKIACKLLFIALKIKLKDLSNHIKAVMMQLGSLPCILLETQSATSLNNTGKLCPYSSFVSGCQTISNTTLRQAEGLVRNSDVLNLQFTSGTTGAPKAAMLTHRSLINNAQLLGNAMKTTHSDVICCPPPLFHCFGLVMGFLGSFTHGSRIVFPCDQFDADQVLDALHHEQCTALLGVPTMFIAAIEANKAKQYKIASVRVGLAAGSSVSPTLVNQLEREFGIRKHVNCIRHDGNKSCYLHDFSE